jgi:hypothetical protein
MKKLIFLTIIICMNLFVHGQSRYNKVEPTDTIFKLGGTVLIVDVTKVTTNYVSFVYPGQDDVYTIERKQIQKIVYSNGRIEELNKPLVEMIDEFQWESVWLTENKKDVVELFKRATIEAKSSPSNRSPKAAKKNAIIKLKKKAAHNRGTIVLVTHKEKTGGYGEFPGYYIKGIVYGPEPLDEEEEAAKRAKSLKKGVAL